MSDWLLSVRAVAAQLEMSPRHVRRLLRDPIDPLPAVKLGPRSLRIDAVDLAAWLARRRAVTPAPPPALFAGFSDDARTVLEGLFCTHTAPASGKTQTPQGVTG